MDRKPKRTLESDLPLPEGADLPVPHTLQAARGAAETRPRPAKGFARIWA